MPNNEIISKIESYGRKIVEIEYTRVNNRFGIGALRIEYDGKSVFVPCGHTPIAVGCGSCASIEEAREKANAGMGIVVDGSDIYRAYYAPFASDDEWEATLSGMSLRSYLAFKAEQNRLHFLRADSQDCGKEIDFLPGTETVCGEARIGKLSNGEWCAEYVSGIGIDDYELSWLFFSCKPSYSTFCKTKELLKIKFKISILEIKEEFECWECGNRVFWLDCGSTIYKAAKNAEEGYCGC